MCAKFGDFMETLAVVLTGVDVLDFTPPMRVTLKDIAAKAGFSLMTVSRALRDQGRMSDETRERIKAIALELGYQPDPALSALVYHRTQKAAVSGYTVLAFLTSFPEREGWKSERYIRRYFEGAIDRASKLGYRVEPFWMREPGMTPKRMLDILEARGIKGVIVAPVQEGSSSIDLDWSRVCAVSLCRNLVRPMINTVDHNHPSSMHLAWREVLARGYSRIGYAIKSYSEEMTGWLWQATFLMEQELNRDRLKRRIPSLVANDWNSDVFEEWVEKYQPDVVVSPSIEVYGWLTELGYTIPEDIGFLHLEANRTDAVSGVCQNFAHVGVSAVDLLHLEIMRSELGVPPVRQSIGIDGVWTEGQTLRSRRLS